MRNDGVYQEYDPKTGKTTIYLPRPGAPQRPTAPHAALLPPPAAAAPVPPPAPALPAPAPAAPPVPPVALADTSYATVETVVHRHFVQLPDGTLMPILPPGAQPLPYANPAQQAALGAYGSLLPPAYAPPIRDALPAIAAAPALPAPQHGVTGVLQALLAGYAPDETAPLLPVPTAPLVALPRPQRRRGSWFTMGNGIVVGILLLLVLPIIPGTLRVPSVQLWALRAVLNTVGVPVPYPGVLAAIPVDPVQPGADDELTYHRAPSISSTGFCAVLSGARSPATSDCQAIYSDLVLRGIDPALAAAEMDVRISMGKRAQTTADGTASRNLFVLHDAAECPKPQTCMSTFATYRAATWAWASAMRATATLTDTLDQCTPAPQTDMATCRAATIGAMLQAVRVVRSVARGQVLVAGSLTAVPLPVQHSASGLIVPLVLQNTGATTLTLDTNPGMQLTNGTTTYQVTLDQPHTLAAYSTVPLTITSPISATAPLTLSVATTTGTGSVRVFDPQDGALP